jgi:hypothetical protein
VPVGTKISCNSQAVCIAVTPARRETTYRRQGKRGRKRHATVTNPSHGEKRFHANFTGSSAARLALSANPLPAIWTENITRGPSHSGTRSHANYLTVLGAHEDVRRSSSFEGRTATRLASVPGGAFGQVDVLALYLLSLCHRAPKDRILMQGTVNDLE